MQPATARVLNHWQDSPDVLPTHALEHRCSIRHPHSHVLRAVDAKITTASHELTRMREHPELFFDWQIDAAFEAREAELQRFGPHEWFDWDCGTCGRIVNTRTLQDPCPKCGAS